MLFESNWLAQLFPSYKGEVFRHVPIFQVSTDSRKKVTKSLFIPLVGDNFDGHQYLKQAIENGAVAALWDENKPLPTFLPTDFPIYFTRDTLKALQYLAQSYRQEVKPTVVGITGSNGKTTTKDIVTSIVKTTYETHATNGNYNNLIGLPLTILGMPRTTEVLILEMGMDRFGEIETLSAIARPDFAIITNIGESHIEYLGSRQGIAKAKLEITTYLKEEACLIIDGDEPLLTKEKQVQQQIHCGFAATNDVVIKQVHVDLEQTIFSLSDGNTYRIPLLGEHHAKNCTYAIAVAKKLQISTAKIQRGLSQLQLSSMRFERLEGKHGVTLINDAYNASPTSMIASIEVIKQMQGFKHKVLVLGDIFELGDMSTEMHQSIVPYIDETISTLFTYGTASKVIMEGVQQRNTAIVCNHFHSIDTLTTALEPLLNRDTIVLFKASRGMKFEEIMEKVI